MPSRVICVKVVNQKGYGLSGYKVKAYGGNEIKTNKEGKAMIDIASSECTIYVNGRSVYSGYARNCDNPLVVVR